MIKKMPYNKLNNGRPFQRVCCITKLWTLLVCGLYSVYWWELT